ncbi:MAG: hypothetical protein A2632_01940 [Candidatus Pacebacteria bacterium RIFCSPHIGHO2_01_FULL_46_16]|nr:MAG: hypothetical protein A2632_01940 [Candidatus Pacebacteria bacterium RIFCSPHIGHO2_01_FULL_46_16]OGJ20676.1 MAG: hypothetical protein A3J60_00635 [Candidatus Pacebacteria bacterium RIFCSPHIGHO2_02_FULL_46_9]
MKETVDFLHLLEKEAALQAKLESKKLLPSQFDAVTAFIGRHTWQVLLVCSCLTALLMEVAKFWVEGSR